MEVILNSFSRSLIGTTSRGKEDLKLLQLILIPDFVPQLNSAPSSILAGRIQKAFQSMPFFLEEEDQKAFLWFTRPETGSMQSS